MYGSRSTRRKQLGEELIEGQQRLYSATQRVAHGFANQNGLSERELQALLVVMHAEAAGQPITAGDLARASRLSSAAATGLIDRLEKAGHVERHRDDVDRRRVTLHYSQLGMAIATTFFGPLADMASDITARYADDELELINRYLAEVSQAMSLHADRLSVDPATTSD